VTAELASSRNKLEEAKKHYSLLMEQWNALEARVAQLEEENRALKALNPAESAQSWNEIFEMSQTDYENWSESEVSISQVERHNWSMDNSWLNALSGGR